MESKYFSRLSTKWRTKKAMKTMTLTNWIELNGWKIIDADVLLIQLMPFVALMYILLKWRNWFDVFLRIAFFHSTVVNWKWSIQKHQRILRIHVVCIIIIFIIFIIDVLFLCRAYRQLIFIFISIHSEMEKYKKDISR